MPPIEWVSDAMEAHCCQLYHHDRTRHDWCNEQSTETSQDVLAEDTSARRLHQSDGRRRTQAPASGFLPDGVHEIGLHVSTRMPDPARSLPPSETHPTPRRLPQPAFPVHPASPTPGLT